MRSKVKQLEKQLKKNDGLTQQPKLTVKRRKSSWKFKRSSAQLLCSKKAVNQQKPKEKKKQLENSSKRVVVVVVVGAVKT